MRYFVYILASVDSGRYYIGQSNNVERRLDEHNDVTRRSWASKYAPWEVMCSRVYNSRAEAMKEEKRLKSFKNRETLESYIRESKLQK